MKLFRINYIVILSTLLSLITIFSFSIVDRSCTSNFYGIFSIWLANSTEFHEYLFFLYGFLINFFILFFLYLIILLLFKRKLSNKWFFILTIALASIFVHFAFKTNIRIHVDPRNTVPKEFLTGIVDKKITFVLINKDIQCPN